MFLIQQQLALFGNDNNQNKNKNEKTQFLKPITADAEISRSLYFQHLKKYQINKQINLAKIPHNVYNNLRAYVN